MRIVPEKCDDDYLLDKTSTKVSRLSLEERLIVLLIYDYYQ